MIRADEFNCQFPDYCEGESTSDPQGCEFLLDHSIVLETARCINAILSFTP